MVWRRLSLSGARATDITGNPSHESHGEGTWFFAWGSALACGALALRPALPGGRRRGRRRRPRAWSGAVRAHAAAVAGSLAMRESLAGAGREERVGREDLVSVVLPGSI